MFALRTIPAFLLSPSMFGATQILQETLNPSCRLLISPTKRKILAQFTYLSSTLLDVPSTISSLFLIFLELS